jgi:hypothetical protein
MVTPLIPDLKIDKKQWLSDGAQDRDYSPFSSNSFVKLSAI